MTIGDHPVFLNYATEQIVEAVKTELNLSELSEDLMRTIDSHVGDATSESYDDGHSDGYSEGEGYGDDRYQEGYDEGYEDARQEFEDAA